LKVECEKKDATFVPSSISEKSVQDEVYHAPMNMKFQTEVVPSLNVMSRCVVPSISLYEEKLDSGAEILSSNMPLNVQIEGTSTDASSASFEEDKDDYLAASIIVPMPLLKTMNDGTYSYVTPQDIEDNMHQHPCENESHIAKLSESENKSELCDSTQCEVESINK
jgi:hypothetical protein